MERKCRDIIHIADLILAELKGTIDAAGRQELEQWKNESSRHQKLYHQYLSEEFIISKFKFVAENDVCKAYQAFEQKVKQRRRDHKIVFYRYAGAIALLLILSGILYFNYRPNQQTLPMAQKIHPGTCKAILTLETGAQVDISDTTYAVYASLSGNNFTVGKEKVKDSIPYHTINIPCGGEYVLTLEDGSRLWMNSASEIRFPVRFSGRQREVCMKGEIFFDIAQDTMRPFVVHTGQGEIKVFGTSFNVKNYRDEDFLETTLVSGKIAFHAVSGSALLRPGEQVRLDKRNGNLTVGQVDVRLFCSWKDGRFVFEKQRLEDIMNTVARWYNIQVTYENPSLKEIRFTGNVKRYEDLDPLIDMLKLVNRLGFEVKGNHIVITEHK